MRPARVKYLNTKTVISAKDLSLTFQTNDGQVQALKDVSLNINQGDFVSFIGPS
jgi:NitT/TauT family transport system ATP-binding protein